MFAVYGCPIPYAGESSINSTRGFTLILFADKRNFQGVDDEGCHTQWSFHDVKEAR